MTDKPKAFVAQLRVNTRAAVTAFGRLEPLGMSAQQQAAAAIEHVMGFPACWVKPL